MYNIRTPASGTTPAVVHCCTAAAAHIYTEYFEAYTYYIYIQ